MVLQTREERGYRVRFAEDVLLGEEETFLVMTGQEILDRFQRYCNAKLMMLQNRIKPEQEYHWMTDEEILEKGIWSRQRRDTTDDEIDQEIQDCLKNSEIRSGLIVHKTFKYILPNRR